MASSDNSAQSASRELDTNWKLSQVVTDDIMVSYHDWNICLTQPVVSICMVYYIWSWLPALWRRLRPWNVHCSENVGSRKNLLKSDVYVIILNLIWFDLGTWSVGLHCNRLRETLYRFNNARFWLGWVWFYKI